LPLLVLVRRNGEAAVAVIEGKAHGLTWRKAGLLQPDIGNLHPGHEGRRRLYGAVVGFGAKVPSGQNPKTRIQKIAWCGVFTAILGFIAYVLINNIFFS